MKKLLLLTTLCVFLAGISFSQSVSKDDALKVGLNFYKHNAKVSNQAKTNFDVQNYVAIVDKNGDDAIHSFSFSDGGFVLVSADMTSIPILGYSYTGDFNVADMAPATKSWINNYIQQIEDLKATNTATSEKNIELWKSYYSNNFSNIKSSGNSVLPLMSTTWSQDRYYNRFCPPVPPNYTGSNRTGKCYAGCVATMMAQVMYYFATYEKTKGGGIVGLPEKGRGSATYNYGGYVTVDLSQTTYKWDKMVNSIRYTTSEESIDAIAEFIYHCGVTMNMNYGPDASGSQIYYSVEGNSALTTNFDYREGGKHVYRFNIPNDEEWKYLIKSELNLNRPVMYAGNNDTVGHAFVCDGYSGDYFHFNWGWGGYLDGYFYIEPVNGNYDKTNSLIYYQGQGIVVGTAPKSTEFPYCGKNNVITFRQGSLEDGSGPNKYFADTHCEWLFSYSNEDPTLPVFDSLKFTFNNFRILAEDALSFYDMTDPSSPELIAKYSGNDAVPESFNTTSKEVMVKFETGNAQGEGWDISYEVIVKKEVGIEENSLTNISIYPNPTKDMIHFEGLEGKNVINIYDISGKQLISVDNYDNSSIDVSSLSNGVYFVNINNGKDAKTMKIIKQ